MSLSRITITNAGLNRAASLAKAKRSMEKECQQTEILINDLFREYRKNPGDEKTRNSLIELCINRVQNLVNNASSKFPDKYREEFSDVPFDVFCNIEKIINGTKKSSFDPDKIINFTYLYIKSVFNRLKNKIKELQKVHTYMQDVENFDNLIMHHSPASGNLGAFRSVTNLNPYKVTAAREELNRVIKASEQLNPTYKKIFDHIIETGSIEYNPNLGVKKESWRSAIHYMRRSLENFRN